MTITIKNTFVRPNVHAIALKAESSGFFMVFTF